MKNGAHAASQAFTAEERDALGVSSTLAIATAGTSPLIYLADQLTKRADTLRAHGKFVSTLPACAAAADLMRHLDTTPDSADSAPPAAAAPQPVVAQRYAAAVAAAAAAVADGAAGTAAGASSSNGASAAATGSSSKASKPGVAARRLEVPLDAIGPLALAHEADMSRLVDYALLREMPMAAGEGLEELPAQVPRGPVVAAIMPRTLDPPAWAPPRSQPVDAQPTASRKRGVPPAPKQDALNDTKTPALGGMGDMHADVKDTGSVKAPVATGTSSGTHGLHAPDELMGGASSGVKPKADTGDLYSDLMSGSEHASKASTRAGKVRSTLRVCMLCNHYGYLSVHMSFVLLFVLYTQL